MKIALILIAVICVTILFTIVYRATREVKQQRSWIDNLQAGDKVLLMPDKKQMRVFANTHDGYVWLYNRKNKFGSMKKVNTYQIYQIKDGSTDRN